MLSEKFEKNVLILELPYNIGICTSLAHANSLHPPTLTSNSGILEALNYTFIKSSKICPFPKYVL